LSGGRGHGRGQKRKHGAGRGTGGHSNGDGDEDGVVRRSKNYNYNYPLLTYIIGERLPRPLGNYWLDVARLARSTELEEAERAQLKNQLEQSEEWKEWVAVAEIYMFVTGNFHEPEQIYRNWYNMAKNSDNDMYHQIMDAAEMRATKRDNTIDICALVNILRSAPNGGGAIVQVTPPSQPCVQTEEDECKYLVKAIQNLCKFGTNDDDNGGDSGSSEVEESAASDKGDDSMGNYVSISCHL